MLKSLSISNFAVIRHLSLNFHEGLNLLTGETGSGKSIIVDALSLLLGSRASVGLIRTDERLAVVEGFFELSARVKDKAKAILAEAELEDVGEELVIRREISASGKSRLFVNDQSVAGATLRLLQPFLVEIHGQGEQRALLSTQSQMEMLDAFAGCTKLRQQVSEAFSRWRGARNELESIRAELSDRDRSEELLQFQLKEIESVNPQPAEDEKLLAEKKVLTHAERVFQLVASSYGELYETDQSVLARLAQVRRQIEELSDIDARVGPLLENMLTGIVSLSEVADALRSYGSGIEFSPARLAEIESRLSDLERLKRKYNRDLDGVIKIRDELSERLEGLEDLDARKRVIENSLLEAEQQYVSTALQLSACRRKAAPQFAERVMKDLQHVALESARFVVSIETATDQTERDASDNPRSNEGSTQGSFFTLQGADRVEFLISTNPGETARSLARVASGGELSRLMLTLRTIGSVRTHAQPPHCGTVVFDEIDVGIGGRVAEAVGRRLKALAQDRQVLCVTHQAQIARFADHHYLVSKFVESGRTVTEVKELSEEERVEELARMIGGDEKALTTLDTARWMLGKASVKDAQSLKKGSRKKSLPQS